MKMTPEFEFLEDTLTQLDKYMGPRITRMDALRMQMAQFVKSAKQLQERYEDFKPLAHEMIRLYNEIEPVVVWIDENAELSKNLRRDIVQLEECITKIQDVKDSINNKGN